MEKETVRKMSLKERYGESFKKLASLSVAAAKIDSTNVYQEENPTTRKIMDALVEDNTLPESHLEGTENFEKFYDEVCAGKRGLILMEHYSNTDLPAFCKILCTVFPQLPPCADPEKVRFLLLSFLLVPAIHRNGKCAYACSVL